MFHSSYIPEYFSLKQLKQLNDYNNKVAELHNNENENAQEQKNKYNYLGDMCNIL